MVHQAAKLHMKLSESKFPFSKRMLNFFEALEITTVKDITDIPLDKLTFCRGFKAKCKAEMIAFIEYEGIALYFKEFEQWKYND